VKGFNESGVTNKLYVY